MSGTEGAVVAVAGATGSLGWRVLRLIKADRQVARAIDLDLAREPSLVGVDTLVYVGAPGDELGPDGLPEMDPVALGRLLAEAPSLRHVVVLSSAMAYGAWPTNPVPLTEETPLRPDPAHRYASRRAETERLVGEWRVDHPDATAAILRPSVSVAAESAAWLALSPWSARALRASGADRPSQFLHLDDLAAALAHARRGDLDGPFNVAPDGWLSRDALADLAGPVGRIHLPAGWVARARQLRSRLGVRGGAAGEAYAHQPWVVANDRLRATGWEPRLRNDEVYVEADPGGPLAQMSPRRRQELSLAGAALAVVGLVAGSVVLIRRRRRG